MILPDFSDVEAAAQRIASKTVRTPVLRSDALDEAVGANVFIKPECLQTTGSFKLRGATNRIEALAAGEAPGGVVAFSSGNHAQGVSRAAKRAGLPALIVMPGDAPAIKVEGVRADGAEIRFYDRLTESREEIAADIAAERQAVLVPSYDDPHIIAGQGTAGLEFIEDLKAAGIGPLDHYVSCAGGGGLLAGAALAFSERSPHTKLWSAEPADYNDHQRSFDAGERIAIDATPPSICDAVLTPIPGELTFAINQPRVSGGFAVNEDEVREAVRFAFRHLKLVVEPGGAVALAAVLKRCPASFKGRNIGIILSGGNVDAKVFSEIVSA